METFTLTLNRAQLELLQEIVKDEAENASEFESIVEDDGKAEAHEYYLDVERLLTLIEGVGR